MGFVGAARRGRPVSVRDASESKRPTEFVVVCVRGRAATAGRPYKEIDDAVVAVGFVSPLPRIGRGAGGEGRKPRERTQQFVRTKRDTGRAAVAVYRAVSRRPRHGGRR